MENNKLQIISVNAKIDKINYDSASIPEQKSFEEGYPMDIQQTVEVVSCDYEKISVKVERSLTLNKNDNPFIRASMIGDFFLDKTTKNNFRDSDELLEYAKKRAGFLIDKIELGAFLSQLIANITGTFGNAPIILPPVLSDNKDNNQ